MFWDTGNSLDYSIKNALNSSDASESLRELLKCVHPWGLTPEVVIIARGENHQSRERTEGKNWASGSSQGEVRKGDRKRSKFYRSRRKARKIKYGRLLGKRKLPEGTGGKNSNDPRLSGQHWCIYNNAWLLGGAQKIGTEWINECWENSLLLWCSGALQLRNSALEPHHCGANSLQGVEREWLS